MLRSLTIAVVLVGCGSVTVGQSLVSPEDRAAFDRLNPDPLPRGMTAEERLAPLPTPEVSLRAAPSGDVRCPAEYEPQDGLLIAWEGFVDVLTSLTVGITTSDPDATVWVVVDSSSERSSASSTLSSAGADMSQVEFIIRGTDSVWMRDYGPRFIFEDGVRAVVDHTYNRSFRPNDNAFNDYLCSLWSEPQYQIPLTHGGGNFHLFGDGDAFMTELILDENPGLSEQDVVDYYADYQGLNLTITPALPQTFDSTQHIDMWMLPVGDMKVIIGDYSSEGGTPYTVTEGVAADLVSDGYTVYRTPGWSSGGTHYTYTNAVILNDHVYIPWYNDATRDAQALAVFQQAMPNHTIHQIDCRDIITSAGALHCIVMQVPTVVLDPEPVVNVIAPDGGETVVVGEVFEIRWNAYDDVAVTSVDIDLSTDGGATFPISIAVGETNDGAFDWTVPSIATTTARVRVTAHDGDGHSAADTSATDFTITPYGPQVIYRFDMDNDPNWMAEGLWEWGVPQGGGGEHGGPDPTSGYTGDRVYGYNLAGDYENRLPETHLTTTPLDFTDHGDVALRFWRWLGVEQPSYDEASISVNNGSGWVTVWTNTGEVYDGGWVVQEFDIAAWADDQPAVQVRWTMGPTDYSFQFCGWNVDDVEFIAIPPAPQGCPGDYDCDDDRDYFDIEYLLAALNGESDWAQLYRDKHAGADPPCDYAVNCDPDGQGDGTTYFDIQPFLDSLGTPCE